MTLDATVILVRNPSVTSRKYLKSTIIEPGISLNQAASVAFDKIDGLRTLGDICSEVIQEYDVGYDDCLRDVIELAAELIDNDIVTVCGGGSEQ